MKQDQIIIVGEIWLQLTHTTQSLECDEIEVLACMCEMVSALVCTNE